MSIVRAIARISLTSADPDKAAAFYRDAFGCERIGVEERSGEDFARLMELPGARAHVVVLRLGKQEIELVGFTPSGRPYPAGSQSNDLWFQHFAIVVADMRQAYAQLARQPGWTPISLGGPQRLPESSGGVTAFKFRDPEGHPLELLELPTGLTPDHWRYAPAPGPFLGIDHSAIAVADTEASMSFYEKLGFTVAGRSLNQGGEQAALDGVPDPVVEVTALQPSAQPPHLELLRYRAPSGRRFPDMRSNDVAKTRLVLDSLEAAGNSGMLAGSEKGRIRFGTGEFAALIRDPDGHDMLLRGASRLMEDSC